jgi:hypothetical protein
MLSRLNASSVPVVLGNAISPLANYSNQDTQLWASANAVAPPAPVSPFVSGMIMPFNGTVAPTGWAICDGTQGTPDLRGRFILGQSASYPFGASGGAATMTLVVNNLPDHTHGLNGQINATNAVVSSNSGVSTCGPAGVSTGIADPGYTPGVPFNILNPHYNLTYIMYL